jgi:hypothetical protein
MHGSGAICLSLLIPFIGISISAAAEAVTLGQVDDFQDGSTQGWGSGAINPNPPSNVPDVGPGGAGDRALQIVATGIIGAGSRLTAFNRTQWAGDYLANGIELIEMDVHNTGATNLELRLAINSAATTQPGLWFSTATSNAVLAASGWQTIAFSLAPADLTAITGVDVGATLSAVTELRLTHSVLPGFQGDPIAAQLLVDNVTAPLPVALPSSSVAGILVLASALALWGRHIIRRPSTDDDGLDART